jgi:hypothetical protein
MAIIWTGIAREGKEIRAFEISFEPFGRRRKEFVPPWRNEGRVATERAGASESNIKFQIEASPRAENRGRTLGFSASRTTKTDKTRYGVAIR